MRLFANFSSRISKKSIENELQGRVLKASKAISRELEEILPYSVKIHWIKETDKQSFFDDNQVIVCMSHTRTRNQNIVCAIVDYVSNGLLPMVRNHIDPNTMKSARLVVSRKLINISYPKGLIYFLEHFFYKETESDAEIKHIVQKMISLDDSGMLIQILVREYLNNGKKYAQGVVNEAFRKEAREFLQFLFDIVDKKPEENVKLDFIGRYFKVSIIFIAKYDTYNEYGSRPYLRRFDKCIRLGIESIYFYARGVFKGSILANIVHQIGKRYSGIDKPKTYNFQTKTNDNQTIKGICVAYSNINPRNITRIAV